MKTLRIVITGDRTYFPGVALTLASTLAFLAKGVRASFTILHERLQDRHRRELLRLATRMRPDSTVDLADMQGVELPAAPTLHRLTYARLFAAGLVEEDTFVYLDSDLLVLRDIAPLAASLSEGWLAAAPRAGRLGDDCPWLDPDTMSPDDDYFCPGVMAVDRKGWIANDIPAQAFEIARREAGKCLHYDQTILNFLLHGKANIVDASWGWNHWEFDRAPAGEPLILHYITGGKPWRAPSKNGVAGLWLSAFQALCAGSLPAQAASLRLRAHAFDARTRILGGLAVSPARALVERLAPGLPKSWEWAAKKAAEGAAEQSCSRVRSCLGRLYNALTSHQPC